MAALDQPLGSENVLSQDELRKYIMYAKQTRRPRLDERLYEKIVQVRCELPSQFLPWLMARVCWALEVGS